MSPTQTNEQSQSTGPRTPEGKARSSMNALRHGLTGRVVVMPHEDLNAYNAFCADLMKDLAPEGPIETQYAQTFCDTQWRLNRIRSIEDSLFALGHCEEPGEIDTNHPEVHAALTAARVFRDNSKAFANLSLYEQRLNRTLKEALRQLHELQHKRREAESKREAQARVKTRTIANKPSPNPAPQFVFSTSQIASGSPRQNHPT